MIAGGTLDFTRRDGLQWSMLDRAISPRSRFALIAYLFLVSATFGVLQPYLPLYYKAAGMDAFQIGWVIAAATALALLLQIAWGRLSDRFDSRRPFVALNAVCAGAAYFALPHASGLAALFVLSALGSNGVLYLNGVGGVLVGRLVQTKHGGTAYAAYRVWGSVGYVVVALGAGALINRFGPKMGRAELDLLFHCMPALFLVILALAYALPDPSSPRTAIRTVSKPSMPANLKWFLLCTFLYVVALYGASNFLSLYMNSVGGSSLWVSAMFAGGVVCEILVMRQSGRFSDRYGRRPLLALTFMLLPIRLALYTLAFSPIGVMLVQVLHGFNYGIQGAVSVALVNDLATDENRGQAQARLTVVSGLASSAGPLILGVAAQVSLRLMFAVAAVVALASAAIFLLKVEETHTECSALDQGRTGALAGFLRLLDSPPKSRPRP